MKTVQATDRIIRLRSMQGMGIGEIINRKLVLRTDWIVACGAEYPVNNWWKRGKWGELRYCGPINAKDHHRKGA